MHWHYKIEKKVFKYLWGTLTSNANFWKLVEYSPQVKLVNLVWIFTYFFKVFPDDFDSYCKSLTKKSWYLFRQNWLMLSVFILKFRNSTGKSCWWKIIFYQVKRFFKVKLNSFFMCFGTHFPAPIREALSIVVRFDIQVKGSFSQNWQFWHILWKTIQSLIQKVLIKKTKIRNKRSWNSWIGLIDIKKL